MAEILYESNYYGVSSLGDSLEHHGIKGQKWGIRRFQNPDGSLTALGKQRYGTVDNLRKAYEKKLFGKGKVLPEPPKPKVAKPKPPVDPEEEKAKAIRDGDVKTILKYAGTMSTQELNEATNRAATIDRLKKMVDTSTPVPAKAVNNMSPQEAASKVDSLSTQEINDVLNRDNAKKRLADLIAPAKKERVSALERIQNTANKLSSLGDSIVNAKNTYDKLQKAFKPKEEQPSEIEERIDKHFNEHLSSAMIQARNAAQGTTKEKEIAAYMVAKDMIEGRKEAAKKAAEIDKAREKAEAAAKRQKVLDKMSDASSDVREKAEERERLKKKYGISSARMWL